MRPIVRNLFAVASLGSLGVLATPWGNSAGVGFSVPVSGLQSCYNAAKPIAINHARGRVSVTSCMNKDGLSEMKVTCSDPQLASMGDYDPRRGPLNVTCRPEPVPREKGGTGRDVSRMNFGD
jgi:hypothetical protein